MEEHVNECNQSWDCLSKIKLLSFLKGDGNLEGKCISNASPY